MVVVFDKGWFDAREGVEVESDTEPNTFTEDCRQCHMRRCSTSSTLYNPANKNKQNGKTI
jgi:N-acetylglutamate synthase-like GNAT family acetyltransferase